MKKFAQFLKNGKVMKKYLKILIVAILIFPCVMIFKGCSCSENSNNSTSNNKSNVTHTVHFYTGTPTRYNIESQEVKDGGLVTKPDTSGWWYYDEIEKVNKTFGDWYSDPSLDIRYVWKFNTDQVYGELTLYAKWNPIPSTSDF